MPCLDSLAAEHPLVPTSYPGAILVLSARLDICWGGLLSAPQVLAVQRGVRQQRMSAREGQSLTAAKL